MRNVVHKLVVVIMVFGLIGGAMSVASSLRLNNEALRLSKNSDISGAMVSISATNQTCDPQSQMTNCAMTHPPIASSGMSCCGCFPAGASNFCIAPSANKVNAFGRLAVTGDSRAPSSLLKPPRA
jgi:hypothetical protein